MEKLQLYIDYIINNSFVDVDDEEIYKLLSEINPEEGQLDGIVKDLYELCKNRKLSKYYVYLSCMANDNNNILQKFIEYDLANANLNAISKIEIFEYVVFKRKHWFLEVLDRFESLGKQYFDENMYQNILIAKLIELTNITDFDADKIETGVLDVMRVSEDEFIEFYKTEVRRVLNIIRFIESLNLTNNRSRDIFNFIICNSLLNSFSKCVNLQERKYWNCIEEKLLNEEVDVFLGFTIVYTILAFVNSDKKHFDDLEKTIQDFFKITSTKLQLEVIKIIFILIFLRKGHLKTAANETNYLNNSISLNIILQFLKNIFETIKIQNRFNDKESMEYKTFMKCNKYLVDAIWRHDLISHVKPSISPQNFIPYMLAPPESLIYLCIKHKDYERAHQVVRVSFINYNLYKTCSSRLYSYCS